MVVKLWTRTTITERIKKSFERWQAPAVIPLMQPLPVVSHVFTLKEMRKATGNFCLDNVIGEGGFGQVFRGILSDGQMVAVKLMDPSPSSSKQASQGEREFRVEVDILSRLSHPNLVRLIGYCADRSQRMLVYEYMSNGNLQELLHGILRQKMDWPARVRVALGSARALEYLHSGRTGNPVIHRDFKSSNILLDKDLNPKVSDFGLAKLVPYGDKHYVSTRVIGTFGYFDPKYTATGRLTVKSDVYGFGVVLLELLTGRRAVDPSFSFGRENLVFRVREALKSKKKLRKVVDSEISPESYSSVCIKRFADLIGRCIRDEDSKRPTMSECVKVLEGIYAMSKTRSEKL